MCEDNNKYKFEDIRSEYASIVNYHTSLVGSRFTIAGLFVAASGFLISAIFNKDASWLMRLGISTLALWLTICLWILELRSRCLYNNVAHRGIEIEHRYWGLTGKEWYSGFFSRQYKEPPTLDDKAEEIPPRPEPDRPRLGWAKKPLPLFISKRISHSMGLYLLYAGSGVFWIIVLIISAKKAFN
ncbi:hypothetical protein FJZ33_10685 [Candidatus Poribacteria bacterium]|nr:hypothetical protein [Candidatus Poribacteria bacterium]